MASGAGKLLKLKRSETKKSHSWWWDSHISPRNSKWLQEHLEEMDDLVRKMLKLIEEDADSFAKKAELYFKKRPELVTLVEDFYRLYRALAERYDNVTGELRRSIPSDLQSQGSGMSDVGSESSNAPDHPKPTRTKSGPRAAGFDFFLDLNRKEGDDISVPESESQSDDSSVNDFSGSQSNEEEKGLRKRISELENELQEMKEKLESQKAKEFSYESSELEQEVEASREKIRLSEDEIVRLSEELWRYKSDADFESLERHQNGSDELKLRNLEEELRLLQIKLHHSEDEIAGLRLELTRKENQLVTAENECSALKNKIGKEEREAIKLQDRMLRYKANLSERDQEVRGLKEAMSNANKILHEENQQLIADMSRLTKERTFSENSLKESELRVQTLEEDLRRAKARIAELKADIEVKDENLEDMKLEIEKLGAEISSKDAEIDEKNKHLHQLHLHHVELIAKCEEARKQADGMEAKLKELQEEVEKKHETIAERAEEKREVIRQLCVSIEHYRSGYHRLRRSIIAHNRPAELAR